MGRLPKATPTWVEQFATFLTEEAGKDDMATSLTDAFANHFDDFLESAAQEAEAARADKAPRKKRCPLARAIKVSAEVLPGNPEAMASAIEDIKAATSKCDAESVSVVMDIVRIGSQHGSGSGGAVRKRGRSQ